MTKYKIDSYNLFKVVFLLMKIQNTKYTNQQQTMDICQFLEV